VSRDEGTDMQWRNTADRYGLIGQALHWLVAMGIVAQYLLAEAAEESKAGIVEPLGAAGIHMALGVAILALATLRVAWRLLELPPEHPPTMKPYEIAVARVAHVAFYVLLFAIPLSGWALATVSDQGLTFLGWFDLPRLQPWNLRKDQFEELHEVLFNLLVALAVVHIAAALKHQLIDHDNVLHSMLPWWPRPRTQKIR
jgi:cytochrome b561